MSKKTRQVNIDNRSRQLNQQKGSAGSDKINSKVHGNRSKQMSRTAKKDKF